MGSGATKAIGNIYFVCRKEASKYNDKLCSREGAAELLGVSVSTLSDYELGLTKTIPPDMVVKMADLYNAPELRLNYCSIECPLGYSCRSPSPMPAERAFIRLQNALSDIDASMEALAAIMDDGVVDENEAKELPAIKKRFLDARQRMDESIAIVEKAERSRKF